MSRPFSRLRRFLLAGTALGISALVFRGQFAQSLVVRGDDLSYQGRSLQALSHYARAHWLDPNSAVATDRYTFTLMQRHTGTTLNTAIGVASEFLHKHPSDATILEDRAICYLLQGRYRQARGDFVHAAQLSSSARCYVFAGWAALHAGDSNGAKQLWKRALTIDPAFRPAYTALLGRTQ